MSLRDELVQVLMEMSAVGSQSPANLSVMKMWQQYLARFSSLLTPSLVNVMFVRSLEKNRTQFPWLPSLPLSYSRNDCSKLLEESMSIQPAGAVDAATRAILKTHIDMLFEMIGTTLTVQFICKLASQRPPAD